MPGTVLKAPKPGGRQTADETRLKNDIGLGTKYVLQMLISMDTAKGPWHTPILIPTHDWILRIEARGLEYMEF